ncbi:hypothetical protein CSOJ01_04784 [Colletotrichum sojae]|uniref:Uncharacterized protein n=1 Tax=Colletotrichum sojae TaxID=2175907 RepID=A0A8H6JI99_9PEZI|nr:hypothetical protein CSOJ01_04784 [Colletotrichum sojae]
MTPTKAAQPDGVETDVLVNAHAILVLGRRPSWKLMSLVPCLGPAWEKPCSGSGSSSSGKRQCQHQTQKGEPEIGWLKTWNFSALRSLSAGVECNSAGGWQAEVDHGVSEQAQGRGEQEKRAGAQQYNSTP